MVNFERIKSSFHKPAWRWVGFIKAAAIDSSVLVVALLLSMLLISTAGQPTVSAGVIVAGCAINVLVGIWCLIWRNQYSTNLRYFGFYDVLNIGIASLFLGAAGGIFFALMGSSHPSLRFLYPILDILLSSSGLIGVRMIQRYLAWQGKRSDETIARGKRVLIVGAGDAGEAIIREVQRVITTTVEIVGLVDDHPQKQSLRIHGVPVLGRSENIPEIADRVGVDEIWIAMPSAFGPEIRRVFDIANQADLKVRTLPVVSSLVSTAQKPLMKQLREVEIQDLLRRQPVKINLDEVAEYLADEHVLVTGAGGSIGSEIARQVAQMNPASLILVGKGENSIYEIEQELIQTLGITPYTIIADVRDRSSMELIYERYRPTVVFHAAAHKHVPLMEKNPREAILNNIQGTFVTAELAVNYGVKKFILISTDKAVKPSSVMGASKRICEMIVCALGQSSEVEFAAVRFGNVLGSRGSLIPLLQAQIRRGGPVTITHKDMSRFFMSIPEASQLVLQAGAIGKRGEVFILDMGEPIKILDLAIELIRMHGLTPGDDIQIKFTGMRPGEKMHEELVYDREDLQPTAHSKIRMVGNLQPISLAQLKQDIEQLKSLFDQPDRLVKFLQAMAWEQKASPDSIDLDSIDEPIRSEKLELGAGKNSPC